MFIENAEYVFDDSGCGHIFAVRSLLPLVRIRTAHTVTACLHISITDVFAIGFLRQLINFIRNIPTMSEPLLAIPADFADTSLL